jgi:hypothetical protein
LGYVGVLWNKRIIIPVVLVQSLIEYRARVYIETLRWRIERENRERGRMKRESSKGE